MLAHDLSACSLRGPHSHTLKRTTLAIAIAAALGTFLQPGISQAQTPQAQRSGPAALSLDEIVVTAQRREQNLQDVPISIAAYSQEKMDIQGLRTIEDIAKFTPSLTFTTGNSLRNLNSRIAIRGVASSVGGSTTGIYINDTPIAIRTIDPSGGSLTSAFPHLFDLQRVEVLRGPQGTLLGSGSEGGTVRFITPDPSLTDSSLYLRAGASTTEYGSPSYEFGAAGGMPIVSDKLGFRASVSTSQEGGYVDHGDYYSGKVTQPDYNWHHTWGARFALAWKPTDRLTILPTIYHQELQVHGSDAFNIADDVPNARLNLQPGDAGYVDTSPGSAYAKQHADGWENYAHFGEGVDDGKYVNSSTSVSDAKQYMDLYSLDVKYELPKISLTYDASVYNNRQNSTFDFTFLSFDLWSIIFSGGSNFIHFPANPALVSPDFENQHNRSFVQEFRAQNSDTNSRFQWVVGAYVQQQDLYIRSVVSVPNWGLFVPELISPAPCSGVAACNAFAANVLGLELAEGRYPVLLINNADNDQQAVYGQVDIHVTDHLTATVGDRYSKMQFDSGGFAAGFLDNGATGNPRGGRSKTHVTTPKLGLQWTTDGGKLIYVSAAKGARNGGTNISHSDPTCLQRLHDVWKLDGYPESYGPDSVWSYELGSKFRAFNDKLTVDADVFRIKWENMITNIGIGGSCIFSYTTNLGDAQSQGVELNAQYYPVENLMLSVNAGYAKVESTQTIPVPDESDPSGVAHDAQGRPQLITRDGAVLPGSHTTASFAAQYSFNAFDNPSYFRIDYSYQGTPKKGDVWDPQSAQYAGAFDLFDTPIIKTTNVRIGTVVDDWNVSFFVNNLTNEQPLLNRNRQQDGVAWMMASTIRPREMGFTAILRY